MKAEKAFSWYPGEQGIFKLPGQDVQGKNWRAFSIASVSSEGVLTIGFRTGENISSFKDKLIHMKKGEKVEVRGPFGWFKIRDNKTPLVMIASGVGVTPIRALTQSLKDEKTRDVHVVYSSKYHLFGDDLSLVAEVNERFSLNKTSSREETKDRYIELAEQYGNEALYYISGSQKVIESIKSNLMDAGISKKRMINDPFLGY